MTTYSATDFYNDELNRLHEKQQNANVILNSQNRMAELNDSYRKRYAKYVQILMVLVLAYGVYLAMLLLQKSFPNISQVAIDVVTVVLIFLVAFYLFSATWELYTRSLLNYDELDIPAYDSSGVDVSALEEKGQIFDWETTGNAACIGENCCPNFYDFTTNTCKVVSSTTTMPSSINTTPLSANTMSSSVTTVPVRTGFTTMEYEKIDTAYTSLPFNSASLKRGPNNNVKPIQDVSVLEYSQF